jgi:hypothetical protein
MDSYPVAAGTRRRSPIKSLSPIRWRWSPKLRRSPIRLRWSTIRSVSPLRPKGSHSPRLVNRATRNCLATRSRLRARLPTPGDDRGDIPGWVMVTLMTAGLVLTLWAVAGPRLEGVFNDAMDRVVGGP